MIFSSHIKYGIKAVLRTPFKTALFILLITTVTGFLSLGVGMYNSAEIMLDEADAVFMTAGEFKFTLGDYPDGYHSDGLLHEARAAFDINDFNSPQVKTLEKNILLRARVNGYIPAKTQEIPISRYAVLRFKVNQTSGYDNLLNGIVLTSYYDNFNAKLADTNIVIEPYENGQLSLLPEGSYIAFGILTQLSNRMNRAFAILPFSVMDIPEKAKNLPPVFDLTGAGPEGIDEFWHSEAGIFLTGIIDKLTVINESIDLIASEDIRAISAFHLNEYVLTAGQFPDSNMENACVIPQRIASQMKLSVGDTIDVSIHRQGGEMGRYDSYEPVTGFAANENFIVAGIYRAQEQNTPVFVQNTGYEWAAACQDDYTLARVTLDNRTAEKYIKNIQSRMPPGVELIISNQGYEAATRSVYNMRDNAAVIMLVCFAAAAFTLLFFAYLFVYRMRETVRILLSLGSGARRALIYLLSGSGVLILISSALGCLIGFLVSHGFIASAYAAANENKIFDYRFSVLTSGITINNFKPSPEVNGHIYVLLALSVTCAALILCFLFGIYIIRKQDARRRFKVLANKKPAKRVSSKLNFYVRSEIFDKIPGLSFRYAVRSAFRGGPRSLFVPALIAVLLIFTFIFNGTRNGYREQLDSVYYEIPVNMYFTGISSWQRDNLLIDGRQARDVIKTGFTESAWFTKQKRYMLLGVVKHSDGTPAVEPIKKYTIPGSLNGNSFSYEIFVSNLNKITDPLIYTNDYTKAREFNATETPDVDWADGWDWTPKEGMASGGCLISKQLADANGISKGDTVAFSIFDTNDKGVIYNNTSNLVIAGVYTSGINRRALILYGDMYLERVISVGGTIISTEKNKIVKTKAPDVVEYQKFDSCGFTLKNTKDLSKFKDWLENHYDPVGRSGRYRRWAIIDDNAFYNTIDSLSRNIGYMDMLYPIMMLAITVIGFIALSLLIKSRTSEINTLRSLGTGKIRLFITFLLEAVFLSAPGILIGIGTALLLIPNAAFENAFLVAACYYAGASAAVLHSYHGAVLINMGKNE